MARSHRTIIKKLDMKKKRGLLKRKFRGGNEPLNARVGPGVRVSPPAVPGSDRKPLYTELLIGKIREFKGLLERAKTEDEKKEIQRAILALYNHVLSRYNDLYLMSLPTKREDVITKLKSLIEKYKSEKDEFEETLIESEGIINGKDPFTGEPMQQGEQMFRLNTTPSADFAKEKEAFIRLFLKIDDETKRQIREMIPDDFRNYVSKSVDTFSKEMTESPYSSQGAVSNTKKLTGNVKKDITNVKKEMEKLSTNIPIPEPDGTVLGPVSNAYEATGSVEPNVVTAKNNTTKSRWLNKIKARLPSMPKVSMPSIGKPNALKKKDAAYYINRIQELKEQLNPVKSQNKTPFIGSIYNNYVKLLNILLADLNNSAKNTSDMYATHLADFVEFIRAYPIIDPAIVVSGKIRDILTFFPKFYKPANDDLVKYVTAIHEYKNAPQLNIPGVFKNYMKINSVFQRFETMMKDPKLSSLQVYAPLMTALSTIYSAELEDFKEKNGDVLTEQRQVELKKEGIDELPKRAKDSTIGVVAAPAVKSALTMTDADMDAIMKAVKEASAVQAQAQVPVPASVPAQAQAQVSIPDKMTLFFDLLKQNNINYLNIFGSIFYLSKLYKNKNIQPALYNIDKFKEMFQVSDDALCRVLKAFAPVFGIETAGFKSQASKVDVDLKLGVDKAEDQLMIEHLTHYRNFLDQRASINAYTKTDNRANEARIAKIDGYIRFLETGMGERVTAVPGLTCSEEDLQKSYIASQAPVPASAPVQAHAPSKSLTALETVALVQGLLQKQPKGDCSDCKEVAAIQRLLKTMIAKGNKNASNSVDQFLKGDEKALETLLELLDRDSARPVEVSEESKVVAEQKVEERFHTIEGSIQKLATVAPEESAKIKQMENTIGSIQTDVKALKSAEPEVKQEDIEKLKFAINEIKDEYPNDGDIKDLQEQISELEDDSLVKLKQIATLFDTIKAQKEINDNKMIAFSYTINELAGKITASEEAKATAKEDADAKIDTLTQQLETFQESQATADTEGKAEQDAIIEELRDEIATLRSSIQALTTNQQTSIVQSTGKYENIMRILEDEYAKKNNIPKDYATKEELSELKTDLDGLAAKVGTEEFTNTIAELRRQIATLGEKTSLDQGAVESIIDGAVNGRFKKIEGAIAGLENLGGLYSELKGTVADLNAAMADKTLALEKIRGEMTAVISKQTAAAEQQTQLQASQTQMQAAQGTVDEKLGELATKTGSLGLRVDTLSRDQVTKTELQNLADQLAAKQGEIDSLKAQIDEKMRECATCKASIDERIGALKAELAATQVPVEADIVEETNESEKKEEILSSAEELKKIKLISLKDHIDKFYQNISSPKLGVYDPDLINLFIKKDQQVIKDYIDKIRDNGFHKIRKDGKILPTFKGAIDLVFSNPSVYPAGVTEKLDRIIFGLFKIFVENVTIVDEENEDRELVGKDKRDSVFNALVAAIGENNLRKIFHQNTIDEVKLKLISNLESYTYLTGPYKGQTIPPPKILTRTTTDSQTALRPILSPLQLKSKRGGALNRTIDDVVFELLARIQAEPSMSEAAIDEMLMEYGVDVDADVSAVEKITGVLNFMRELYDI